MDLDADEVEFVEKMEVLATEDPDKAIEILVCKPYEAYCQTKRAKWIFVILEILTAYFIVSTTIATLTCVPQTHCCSHRSICLKPETLIKNGTIIDEKHAQLLFIQHAQLSPEQIEMGLFSISIPIIQLAMTAVFAVGLCRADPKSTLIHAEITFASAALLVSLIFLQFLVTTLNHDLDKVAKLSPGYVVVRLATFIVYKLFINDTKRYMRQQEIATDLLQRFAVQYANEGIDENDKEARGLE